MVTEMERLQTGERVLLLVVAAKERGVETVFVGVDAAIQITVRFLMFSILTAAVLVIYLPCTAAVDCCIIRFCLSCLLI